MIPVVDSKAMEMQSKSFIHSLDRSALGRFVVDRHHLFLTDVAYRLLMEYGGHPSIAKDPVYNHWGSELAAINPVYGSVDWAIDAEAMYWWVVSGDEEMIAHYHVHYSSNPVEEITPRLGELFLIAANPGMHDYFAAGVWDVVFVERCIADGIDPSMAVSMLADGEAVR